jgi:hypothetical protein
MGDSMPTYYLKPKDQERLGFTKLKIKRERLPGSQGTRYDFQFYDGRKPSGPGLGAVVVRKVKDGVGGRNWDVSVSANYRTMRRAMLFEITRSKTRRQALNKLERDLRFYFREEWRLKLPIRL